MTKNAKIYDQLRIKGGKVLASGARQWQREVIKLFGSINFDLGFNYKAERAKR